VKLSLSCWVRILGRDTQHKHKSCTRPSALFTSPAAYRDQQDVGGDSQVPGATSAPEHLATQLRQGHAGPSTCRASSVTVAVAGQLGFGNLSAEAPSLSRRRDVRTAEAFPGPRPANHMLHMLKTCDRIQEGLSAAACWFGLTAGVRMSEDHHLKGRCLESVLGVCDCSAHIL
jgi:hypothetical protein